MFSVVFVWILVGFSRVVCVVCMDFVWVFEGFPWCLYEFW